MISHEQVFKAPSAHFTQNIAWLRSCHHYTKAEMAARLGIGVSSLTKIESGLLPKRLSANVILRIKEQFGIEPHDLLCTDLSSDPP